MLCFLRSLLLSLVLIEGQKMSRYDLVRIRMNLRTDWRHTVIFILVALRKILKDEVPSEQLTQAQFSWR